MIFSSVFFCHAIEHMENCMVLYEWQQKTDANIIFTCYCSDVSRSVVSIFRLNYESSQNKFNLNKGPYRIFGVFWPTTLIQWTHIFGLKLFLVHKNIFLSNFFIFGQRGPIFTLVVVAVFPKQVLLRQSTQKSRAQKQPRNNMRIRIPKFFSVLTNWWSHFFYTKEVVWS